VVGTYLAFDAIEKGKPEYWHAFIEEGVDMGKKIQMKINEILGQDTKTPSTTFSTDP